MTVNFLCQPNWPLGDQWNIIPESVHEDVPHEDLAFESVKQIALYYICAYQPIYWGPN